jgi:hypothetical protein
MHPILGNTYNTRASILYRTGSHAEAFRYAQIAENINRKTLPSDRSQHLILNRNLETIRRHTPSGE